MEFPVTLIGEGGPNLFIPGLVGQLAWLVSAALLGYLAWRSRGMEARFSAGRLALLAGLVLGVVVVILFTGIRFPISDPLIVPGRFGRQESVLLPVLAAVPVMLAAGFSGPISAALIGLAAGTTFAAFSTYNLFTILIFGYLGYLAGVFLRQRYRTPAYRFLRLPFAAAICLSAIYPLFYVPGALFGLGASLIVRLNFAFHLLVPEAISAGVMLVAAGAAGEAARRIFPAGWGVRTADLPSPAELSLETRSIQLMGVAVLAAMLALSVVGWGVAYASSMQLTRGRMMSSADLAAESLPNALDTGQSLIQIYLADERLADPDPDTARTVLREKLDTGLYFAELMLVEPDGSVLVEEAAAPGSADALSAAESSGVVLAAEGVPFQYYSSGAPEGGAPIVISFIAPVPGSGRVLVGRSLLAGNPFISPLLESVHNLSDIQGQGLLVDEAGLILHHPVPQMVGTGYGGALKAEGGFSTSATPDGQPALVYAVPVDGRSWMVVVEVPMSAVQIRALRLAAPFVGLLAALAVGSLVTLRVILSVVTGSLRTLAVEAAEIGEKRARLATPIESSGVDEVGRMRAAFERMRASLNARMVEQEQLLRASHGAASSLDFNQAVRPILAAALSGGAESARVVLSQGTLPDSDANQPGTFGAGPKNARFAYLDGQVLRILENEDRLVTRNPIGHPGLNFENGRDIPSGLAGLPLRHDQDYFGVIWLGYSGRHTFSDDEVVFLSTLAAQASLAVANTRLFRSAEVERERLAAILASTPDPIIVTDRDNRLFHANLAAEQVLGERLKTGRRQPIETLIDHPGLIELICSDPVEPRSIEVGPETGGTYVAKVTAFVFRGERIGKVCILRDITRYKELDTLKSELVSNVGHDLDQPLQIILGYTTMLPIVGPMSAEQQVYVNKISLGVQRVKEMVNNLVSMGKIEAGVGLTMVALSLVDLTIQTLRERQTQASQKRVHLTIVPPAERIPDIFGDEVLILRAIGNLVDNAIKYSNNDGSVRISFSVRQAGSVVRMSIDDQGIGIALPDQDRLFERFYRSANPETRKRHGTGLGLAIVRSIVEAHGGRVWFESTPGRGSSFHIELPAVHQGSDG